MKKITRAILLLAFLFPLISNGQEAKEGTIKIGKDEKPGFIATSKYSTSEVEDIIAQRLKSAGINNGKKKSKFYTYKEVQWTDISHNKIDLYYKVQKKKHKSTIYMVVSKGYDNYVTANSDGVASKNIIDFLDRIDGLIMHNAERKRKAEEIGAMNDKIAKEKEQIKIAEDEKNKKAKELNDLKSKQ